MKTVSNGMNIEADCDPGGEGDTEMGTVLPSTINWTQLWKYQNKCFHTLTANSSHTVLLTRTEALIFQFNFSIQCS